MGGGEKKMHFRIGLNKLINYFIKHWLLSIIFGLRTALVAIRKILTYKKTGFQTVVPTMMLVTPLCWRLFDNDGLKILWQNYCVDDYWQ